MLQLFMKRTEWALENQHEVMELSVNAENG